MRIPTDDNSATLHALFPTLVYQANLDDHAAHKAAFAADLEDFQFQPESGDGGKHFAGEYHGKILLHQEQSLRPFFELLSTHVAKYLRVLGMKPEFFQMQCLKTWFVLCEPGGDEADALLPHNHSCSDISWVYYVDVPDDCPAIRFHAAQRLNTAPFESAFHYDWKHDEKSAVSTINWWNSQAWSIHPKTGDLMIFPGHQLHSVDSNHTNTKRISVAGDIALVLKEEFTNLEFGRTAAKHWLTLGLDGDG
jgi:uncharacterized protein (TIGR02466 family)